MRKFREKASANRQIKLRPNRELENVFRAYETSWETERLDSERNRQIYCELIDWKRNDDLRDFSVIPATQSTQIVAANTVNDDDEEGEEQKAAVFDEKQKWWTQISVESRQPKTLAEMSIEEIAKGFKSGPISNQIPCQDAEDFGLLVDIELPILDLLELDNETYWKRVVQANVHDVLRLQKLLRDPETNWKQVGLELKLAELIENLEESRFEIPSVAKHLRDMTDKLKDFVENLTIQRLKMRKGHNKSPIDEQARVVNYSSNECYHGSLEFISGLINLKTLSIKFNPGRLDCKYERRFFQVALIDIENIGKALTSLKKLENFAIRQSDLNEPRKIYCLLTQLKVMEFLETVDLSFCNVTSKASGQHFEDFLKGNRSLKHLELKGNFLGFEFCTYLAMGIKVFSGKLNYLGLALTPILGNGLGQILQGIEQKGNVERLDISKCDNGLHGENDECIESLIRLIERQSSVREINMNDNGINRQLTKDGFIKAIDKNFNIENLTCENCGFNSSELVDIKVLVLRNKYYKDYPFLKKDHFTVKDEIEIEEHLKRTKHPLLVKYKKKFVPQNNPRKPFGVPERAEPETTENYMQFASSTKQGSSNYFD